MKAPMKSKVFSHRTPRSSSPPAGLLATRYGVGVLVVAAACTASSGPTITEWQGERAHLILQGHIGGHDLDVAIEELDTSEQDRRVWCERVYAVPMNDKGGLDYDAGALMGIDIHAMVESGDVGHVIIQFGQHDFQRDADGTTTTIVPRNELEPPASMEAWLEIDLFDDSESVLFEQSAQQGSLIMERLTGRPDPANGLVIPSGEGLVGGFSNAQWGPREDVAVSFTVNCLQSIIVEET